VILGAEGNVTLRENVMEVDGELVMSIRMQNGMFVSPSDKKVQLEAYELKTYPFHIQRGFQFGW
jgi:hypothetical protein